MRLSILLSNLLKAFDQPGKQVPVKQQHADRPRAYSARPFDGSAPALRFEQQLFDGPDSFAARAAHCLNLHLSFVLQLLYGHCANGARATDLPAGRVLPFRQHGAGGRANRGSALRARLTDGVDGKFPRVLQQLEWVHPLRARPSDQLARKLHAL